MIRWLKRLFDRKSVAGRETFAEIVSRPPYVPFARTGWDHCVDCRQPTRPQQAAFFVAGKPGPVCGECSRKSWQDGRGVWVETAGATRKGDT
jgi:hypothetical protein